MFGSQENKTEMPTELRRRWAREQGFHAYSPDLTSAIRMLGVAVSLSYMMPELSYAFADLLSRQLTKPVDTASSINSVFDLLGMNLFRIMVPTLGVLTITPIFGLAAQYAQRGLNWDMSVVQPDFSRFNPFHWWMGLADFSTFTETLAQLSKFFLALGLAFWLEQDVILANLASTSADLIVIANVVWGHITSLCWKATAIMLVIGSLDYGYRYWKFERMLMMSPDEIREEQRNQRRSNTKQSPNKRTP